MDPITIGLAASSIAGGFMRANAARRAAHAQAQQDIYNAQLAEAAARDAKARGEVNEGNVRRRTSDVVSADQAQLGASGVDVQSGSALDTLAGQRMRGELAARVVRSNAAREAWGYAGTAAGLRAKAAYAEQSGDQDFISSLISGGAGALSAAHGTGGGNAGSPGIDYPLIRVGEPTVPEAWMRDPMAGFEGG